MKLCGFTLDRDKVRACLVEKGQSLSQDCRADMLQQARDKMAKGAAIAAPAKGATEYRYGTDAAQALDFYPATAANAPLIVFIHGGGWTRGDKAQATGVKATHFTAGGYAFASINYRMVPAVDPSSEAADVAAAIAWLRQDAAKLGLDPNRIILMGHSAGAHLAALVGTDERYFAKARVPMSALRGIVLLDGAAYDVSAQMKAAGPMLANLYGTAFGQDHEKQVRLSPVTYASAHNVKDWLIVHDANRADSGTQARGLAAALHTGGATTKIVAVPDSSHMKINRDLGVDGDFLTKEVDAFLKAAL